MQITSSIEPVPVLDHTVEAPTTPLWTRHTIGAIEADRDRRHARRAYAPIRYRTAPRAATNVVQADFAGDRWADAGGSFDREAAAELRVASPRR